MKTFLVIFTCAENSQNHLKWKTLSPEMRAERVNAGEEALKKWNETNKDRILFEGGPLSGRTKLIDQQGVKDLPSRLGSFLVIQADSGEEAASLFVSHPHFSYFPGDGVEILERIDGPRP